MGYENSVDHTEMTPRGVKLGKLSFNKIKLH